MNRLEVQRNSKRMFALAALMLVFGGAGAAGQARPQPVGTIEKVWFEERVQVNKQLGIQIHAKYNIRNAQGMDCRARATFFTPDGTPIVAPPKSDYATGNGNAGVTKTFKPKYDNSDYPDTKLGIPYWALNLRESNPNKMKFHVTVRCNDKGLATSNWFDFSVPIGKVR